MTTFLYVLTWAGDTLHWPERNLPEEGTSEWKWSSDCMKVCKDVATVPSLVLSSCAYVGWNLLWFVFKPKQKEGTCQAVPFSGIWLLGDGARTGRKDVCPGNTHVLLSAKDRPQISPATDTYIHSLEESFWATSSQLKFRSSVSATLEGESRGWQASVADHWSHLSGYQRWCENNHCEGYSAVHSL